MNNDEVIDFYRQAYKEHGDTPAGMRWGDQETHLKRLWRIGELVNFLAPPPESVLDVGCGIGMLHQVWGIRETGVRYTGVDLVPEYVAIAASIIKSDPNAIVFCDDFLTLPIANRFSATLAVGTFAWVDIDIVRKMLERMWELTADGGVMAFTYLPDNPLSDFEVNRLGDMIGVAEMVRYSGYSDRLHERMVLLRKANWGGDVYKHREEIEQEVVNGEHRDEEE